jgi:hypothetical protein
MVIALFVVALAMIVAGVTAIYDGSGIVVMERGWTKVISGTVGASSGFVLLGIACVVLELKRIGASLPEQAASLPGPLPLPPRLPVSAPLTAAPGAAAEPSGEAKEPAPDRPQDARREDMQVVDVAPKPAAAAEQWSPPERPVQPVAEDREPEASESRDETRAAEAPPSRDERAAEAATIVVGTYSSGGNDYVMYADGSIKAETPTGLYRFESLDELKAFIAAGGESGSPPPGAGRRA